MNLIIVEQINQSRLEQLLLSINRCNTFYGVFGILDRLHQTDGVWRRSEMYHRHRVLLSFRAPECREGNK